MLTLGLVWLAGCGRVQADLSSALVVEKGEIERIWQKGFDEAKKTRDLKGVLKPLVRGIGNIRSGPLTHETVSYLWLFHPKASAYADGHYAKKRYLPDNEVQANKNALDKSPFTNGQYIVFAGVLGIYPSFGGPYGKISREADANDLRGVRVVLQVGDRIYQPISQPGDLTAASGVALNSVFIPQASRSTTTSSFYGTVQANGSYGSVWGNGASTTTNYYSIQRAESYQWYQATFLVAFSVVDENGKAVVRKADKEMTAIVIYGTNERKATYKMEELEKYMAK